MRILKNHTAEACEVTCGQHTVEIPANDQADLSESFSNYELATSETLLRLLGQGEAKYQLNDGTRDYAAGEAIDLIRGYQGVQPEKDDDGRLRVSTEPRKVGSPLVVVTHNWCDPTTWYTQSVRVTDEVLSDSGDGLTFNSAHENWVDLTHGKIYREDLISSPYLPELKVDGDVKTVRAPWADSGGDFQIDYSSGAVTFFESQAGKTVTASYSYANGSLFIITPTTGKRLWVEYSEVQFSADIDIKANTNFQPWAYNPQDLPNKMPAASATVYKTLDNYIEEANGAYPVIPAMGGTRGFAQNRLTFPFKYQTIKELHSSLGVEIRVWLTDDVPYGGEYGTATFYCTSYTEQEE